MCHHTNMSGRFKFQYHNFWKILLSGVYMPLAVRWCIPLQDYKPETYCVYLDNYVCYMILFHGLVLHNRFHHEKDQCKIWNVNWYLHHK